MKFNDAISGLALGSLAIAVLVNASGFPAIPGQNIGPAAFPSLLAGLLLVCAVLLVIKGLRGQPAMRWIEWGAWTRSPVHLRNFLITLACLLFYILASDRLGFLVCAFSILCVMFAALGVRRRLIIPVAMGVTLLVHTIFYKGLRVPLPWGILMPWQW
jgi:putative tricarboxylic transport membrane protein